MNKRGFSVINYSMRRSYVISDWFFRFTHALKRNRASVLLYALFCVVFLVIGVAIGVNVSDKLGYVVGNGAPLFRYLTGESGAFAFFFIDLLFSMLYALFAASMFFFRIITLFSFAPCIYRSYALGMSASIVVVVYSASAIPMLVVLFVPACLVEICIDCVLSFRCRQFAALNCRCLPSRIDVKEYYKSLISFFICVAACSIVKMVSLVLFGSALIGIVGV